MRKQDLVDATAGETARRMNHRPAVRRTSMDATAGKSARRKRIYSELTRRNLDATDPRYGDLPEAG